MLCSVYQHLRNATKLEHFMKTRLIVTILDKICHLCFTIYTICFNVNFQTSLLHHDLTKTLENRRKNAREKVAFMSTFANCHHFDMLCIVLMEGYAYIKCTVWMLWQKQRIILSRFFPAIRTRMQNLVKVS